MRYLSHSQISSYERCPFQWYASYVLRYRRESNADFAEGRAVHAAIASHWQGNKYWEKTLRANLDKELEGIELEPPPGFGQVEKAELVNSIFTRDSVLIRNMLDLLETKFGDGVETIEVERKQKKNGFVGVIDWRGRLNSVEYIIDWKTSGKAYKEERVHEDEQLTAYAALTGVRHVAFGVMNKSDLTVQFLTSARTKDECTAYWEKVEYIRSLMDAEGPYAPCNEGWWCNWCSFQRMCPLFGDF